MDSSKHVKRIEVDIDAWPHRRKVGLTRHVFATRTAVPLPNGFKYDGPAAALGTGATSDDVNWVTFQVHHVVAGPSHIWRAAEAVFHVAGMEAKATAGKQELDPSLQEVWTVIDAVTPSDVSSTPDPALPAIARTWSEDPLMRIIYVMRQVVRAERSHTQGIMGIPSYEQVLHPVLGYQAVGEQLLASDQLDARVLVTLMPEWANPFMITLEHGNVTPDRAIARTDADQHDPVLRKWLIDLELGLPSVLWRERLTDADHQFRGEGRYDLAVILSATATEVLIDGLLQLLWWEQSLTNGKTTAETVAAAFDSSKDSVARMNKYLIPLLGGNWSDPKGPIQQWIAKTWKLRHRCVHGGYYPTHQETAAALASSHEIATFLFDRISDKRNTFPRICLHTVAPSGLKKRGLWGGKIKHFHENDAQKETDWRFAIKGFRNQVEQHRQ